MPRGFLSCFCFVWGIDARQTHKREMSMVRAPFGGESSTGSIYIEQVGWGEHEGRATELRHIQVKLLNWHSFHWLTELFRSSPSSNMGRDPKRAPRRTPRTPFDDASQVYEVEANEAKRREGGNTCVIFWVILKHVTNVTDNRVGNSNYLLVWL